MKSRDFTKIAMMGVIGGCLLGSAQASANVGDKDANGANNNKGVLLAHSCGAGCKGGSRSYVADNSSDTQGRGYSDRNQQANDNSNQQTSNQPTSSGCGAKSGGCGAKTRPNNNETNQQTASGCGAKNRPNNWENNQQTASGCGAKTRSNNWENNQQTASGCGAKNRPNNNNGYNVAENDMMQGSGQQMSLQMTDEDFVKNLNAESKTAYNKLSAEGKAWAQKLASQGTDKNAAIKMAAQKLSEKRASMNQSNQSK